MPLVLAGPGEMASLGLLHSRCLLRCHLGAWSLLSVFRSCFLELSPVGKKAELCPKAGYFQLDCVHCATRCVLCSQLGNKVVGERGWWGWALESGAAQLGNSFSGVSSLGGEYGPSW